ncbi:hypothetical protein L917_04076 [Phytophthora nicotianae]|nr:hypothetical protein L917_04076 [Phytophthora nicotianae]ETO83704.1 hypothetical protein F444_02316 [Phytophthora nicotianae P1976]
MNQPVLARELLRSTSQALHEIQEKMEKMKEALNDLLYAREEMEAMLHREEEIINELSASIGGVPPPRGFPPSYGMVLGRVIRILTSGPPAQ